MSRSKRKSLLQQLQTETPIVRSNGAWWRKLSPDNRAEMDAIREAFRSGRLQGWSMAALYRRVKSVLGITVSIVVFRRFFSDEGESPQ